MARLYVGESLPEAKPDWLLVGALALDLFATVAAIALLLAL